MKHFYRKKLSILVLFLISTVLAGSADDFETADEAVANMRVGWNLGNTLESNSGDTLNMWIEHWTERRPSDYETSWKQPVTTSDLLKLFKDAGFNAVRVPVTWYPHMEAEFDFPTWENSIWNASQDDLGTKIDPEWMNRVHEVVDYVIDQGMYCILNVHHDTGDASTAWLRADEGVYEKQRDRYEAIWKQIAEEFKDYDGHLIFEGYNEMLDIKGSWCFASFNTPGRYNKEIAESAYNGINKYAQSFVDAVRSTGGNNVNRNLIVSTYGACDGNGDWNEHLSDPLRQLKIPEDISDNHIIMEVHSYPSVKNLSEGKQTIDNLIKGWKTHLLPKGAPMIVGEWSISLDNEEERHSVYRHLVEKTKENNIAVFHWMGLSDGESRSIPEFDEPYMVDAIIKGYYGEGGYEASTPSLSDDNDNLSVDVYTSTGILLYRNVAGEDVTGKLLPGLYIIGGKLTYIK